MKYLKTSFTTLSMGAGLLVYTGAHAGEASSFFDHLRLQAMASAREPRAVPEHPELPEFLRDLDYDGYQRIRFRPEQSLWHNESPQFQVQFFHPGYLYQDPVRIHVLDTEQPREIQFAPDLFDYGPQGPPGPIPRNSFLTGLRILHAVDPPTSYQEIAAFHGSSYFRLSAIHQVLGASARGLAIDTAESSGEEFPQFTEFWLEKPADAADHVRLFARLESRRAAAAYQFLLRPGNPTFMEVEASLFLREKIAKLGLAPLTSMFFFGENRDRYFPDFRPEVHDSDGLLFETKEGWFWRPLENPPKTHRVSAFPDPIAFGLFQRDRTPAHYQDLEAHYQRRPSYWIEPKSNWGGGRLELVEIPTPHEGNDNIVAFWVPAQELQPAQEFRFHYVIHAGRLDGTRPPVDLWRVHATRLHPLKDKQRTRFLVDWTAHSLPVLARKPLVIKTTASQAKIENVQSQPNDLIGGWRTFFDVLHENQAPAELRLWLEQDNRKVSETWIYHFSRDQ
jgi:periplasmic glucans biosynthesis protein